MASAIVQAHDALRANRADVIELVQGHGAAETKQLLEEAARDLTRRIRARVRPDKDDTFTLTQLKATLAQVEDVLKHVVQGIRGTVVTTGGTAAEAAADHTAVYLRAADKAFRGVGVQPLALDQARMLSEATEGVNASILRRLASSGEPIEGADDEPHPAKVGILQRYGVETIGYFENELRRGFVTKKSWSEMEADLTARSPFLQGAPASWARRIVRTECMAAYGRSTWESIREADEQLEDMVKILVATFDDRTSADSYAVHGQIRRPEEAFLWWDGLYQHPPNRPNDREIILAHRVSWPIPEFLEWKDDDEVEERWRLHNKTKEMPERPDPMTTVPLALFGQRAPQQLSSESKQLSSESKQLSSKSSSGEPVDE